MHMDCSQLILLRTRTESLHAGVLKRNTLAYISSNLDRGVTGPGGCLDGLNGGAVAPVLPQQPPSLLGGSPLGAAGAQVHHPQLGAVQPQLGAVQPQIGQDPLNTRKQAVVDRLRRRIESYRKRQTDCIPRFDQSFNGLCEQNLQDTLQLKQRYLDAKNKQRPTGGQKTKHQDKQKQQQLHNATIQQQQEQSGPIGQNINTASSSIQSSVHVQQKFLKRPADDLDPGGTGTGNGQMGSDGSYEPPVKLQCTTQSTGGHQSQEGGLTKFSVEIVQQLEFTTSAANSQPQQISTNVTVKAHTNTSVKSDISSPKSSNPSTPSATQQQSNNSNTSNTNNANTTNNSGTNASLNKQNSDVNSTNSGSGLVDCVKQEPDNEFVDLEQCAAALEKDAVANGGTGFGGLPDFIGDDTNDEIITSDAFKELIYDISNYNEFMHEFDFEDKSDLGGTGTGAGLMSSLKVEDLKDFQQQMDNQANAKNANQQQQQQQQNNNANSNLNASQTNTATTNTSSFQNNPMFEKVNSSGNRVAPYHPGMDFVKTELSPAAQTLKQMAEQHQHKTQGSQMGGSNPGSSPFGTNRSGVLGPGSNNPRSPYHTDFHSPFQGSTPGDYGSPGGPSFPSPQIKNSPGFPSPHHQAQGETVSIKQEQQQQMLYQQGSAGPTQQQAEMDAAAKQRKNLYKQQYSPYGSPAGGHGSPGYLPSRPTPASNNAFGGGTPPRNPSDNGPNNSNQNNSTSGSNNNQSNIQINQAQQLHINQQQGGIQVSAGQQLQLSAELKGNVSIATQQGMHFNQNMSNNNGGQSQNQQQNSQQQNPNSHHHQQQNVGSNLGQQNQNHGGVQQQQSPMHGTSINQGGLLGPNGGNMMGSGNVGMGLGSPATGGMTHHHHQHHSGGMGGLASQQHLGQQLPNTNQMMAGDAYSLTQSQTINFTQQSLRQRNAQAANGMSGMMGNMGPGGMPMGGAGGQMAMANSMRHMQPHQQQQANQLMEHQKMLQQQQMLRVQQQQQQQNLLAAQQQQMIRPPPPDYKSTAAGMMQQQGGLTVPGQPRYATSGLPPGMRRMPHQPMPPSGPMMRPHSMYMMQQQQQQGMMVGGTLRGIYRQPAPPMARGGGGAMEQMGDSGNAEWRHLMMSQQQTTQFQQGTPMRGGGGFQHASAAQGFGVNSVMGSGNTGGGNLQQQMNTLQQQQQLLRAQQQGAGGGVMSSVMGNGNGPQGMGGLLGQQSMMGGPQPMGSGNSMGGPPGLPPGGNQMVQHQLLLQQQQSLLQQQQQQMNAGNGSQMSINSMHMQQSQSLSISSQSGGVGMQQGGALGSNNNPGSLGGGFPNSQSADDFNLDFLTNMPGTDGGAFTEQELLNSFDSDSGFNLQDIL